MLLEDAQKTSSKQGWNLAQPLPRPVLFLLSRAALFTKMTLLKWSRGIVQRNHHKTSEEHKASERVRWFMYISLLSRKTDSLVIPFSNQPMTCVHNSVAFPSFLSVLYNCKDSIAILSRRNFIFERFLFLMSCFIGIWGSSRSLLFCVAHNVNTWPRSTKGK